MPGDDGGKRSRTATLTHVEPEPVRVAGRHSRGGPLPAAMRAPSGRHAAGRPATPRAAAEPIDLDLVLDLDGEVTPDQVEEIADQMLDHLAVSEPRSTLLVDLDEMPGGKWGVMAGGAFAFIVVTIVLSFILNFLFNR